MVYDRIIIGAGLYGLYSALLCAKQGKKTIVLEKDSAPFQRATYINQARVHMGYHYPRSISTAKKSADYFKRFCEDFGFCIHSRFKQIYATSSNYSWTAASQFEKFCHDTDIYCENIFTDTYFKPGMCDGAFSTEEYTYDAQILKEFYLKELKRYPEVEIKYNVDITEIKKRKTHYDIYTADTSLTLSTDYILNVTYASVNQMLKLINDEPFKLKYELCEIILCEVNERLRDIGITVMDGPFFSIMPFGKTGLHSLTSVAFTPHITSYASCPDFSCQTHNEDYCNVNALGNCSKCKNKPDTAWDYMSKLADKYLRDEYKFTYKSSLFSMKPILKASEIDDSRPTVIKYSSEDPTFISVLSGKINTVYDLDLIV